MSLSAHGRGGWGWAGSLRLFMWLHDDSVCFCVCVCVRVGAFGEVGMVLSLCFWGYARIMVGKTTTLTGFVFLTSSTQEF